MQAFWLTALPSRPASPAARFRTKESPEQLVFSGTARRRKNFVCGPLETVDERTERAFELSLPLYTRQLLQTAGKSFNPRAQLQTTNTPLHRQVCYQHCQMRRNSAHGRSSEAILHLYLVPSAKSVIFNDFRFFSVKQLFCQQGTTPAVRKRLVGVIIDHFLELALQKPPLIILEDYVHGIAIHAGAKSENGGILNSQQEILRSIALQNFYQYRDQVYGLFGEKSGEKTLKQLMYIKYLKTGRREIAVNIQENEALKRVVMLTMDVFNRKMLESIVL